MNEEKENLEPANNNKEIIIKFNMKIILMRIIIK
jgi:hypothetical protein